MNPDVGWEIELLWVYYLTSQEPSVVAGKEGNQSVISDVMEGEAPSSLINVHRSIF